MIIDMHTHFYPDPVARKVMSYLRSISSCTPIGDGTWDDTRREMLEAGVDKVAVLPIAMSPHYHRSNTYAAEMAEQTGCVIPFGTIWPDEPQVEAKLEGLLELGCKGVKLHPQNQQVAIDDPRYIRIIRAAAKLRLPVIFHGGFDPGLPPPYLACPDAIARMLDQVEDEDGLILVAAHLGALDMHDDVERYLVGRNIYFDTAMVHNRIPLEQFRRIVDAHGWQRIIMGSDYPWQKMSDALTDIYALGLPKEQEQAIMAGNAQRIFGLDE